MSNQSDPRTSEPTELPITDWDVTMQDGEQFTVMAAGFNIMSQYVVFFGPDAIAVDIILSPRRITPKYRKAGNA